MVSEAFNSTHYYFRFMCGSYHKHTKSFWFRFGVGGCGARFRNIKRDTYISFSIRKGIHKEYKILGYAIRLLKPIK